MNEFEQLEKSFSKTKKVGDLCVKLVKEKKAHMFIMLFDSSEITKDDIIVRAANAFKNYKVHTWFLGEE